MFHKCNQLFYIPMGRGSLISTAQTLQNGRGVMCARARFQTRRWSQGISPRSQSSRITSPSTSSPRSQSTSRHNIGLRCSRSLRPRRASAPGAPLRLKELPTAVIGSEELWSVSDISDTSRIYHFFSLTAIHISPE